jgi:hypothetical protein
MRIVVHIEQLVLDGFSEGTDRRKIQAAIEHELSRLLAVAPSSAKWRGGAVDLVNAPAGSFIAADRSQAIGHNIARAAAFGIATAQAGAVRPAFATHGGAQPR